MIYVPTSNLWPYKPPPGSRIDTSHPLADGLQYCLPFNEGVGANTNQRFHDAVSGRPLINIRNDAANQRWAPGTGPHPYGPVMRFAADGGTANLWQGRPSPADIRLSADTGITAAVIFAPTGGNAFLGEGGLFHARVASGETGPYLRMGSTQTEFGATGSGIQVGTRLNLTPTLDRWYCLVGTFRKDAGVSTYGGVWSLYLDGDRVAQNNYNGGGSFGGSFTSTGLGILSSSATALGVSSSCDRWLSFYGIWNRELRAGEVRSLWENPWQVFERRLSRATYFVPLTGVPDTTTSGSGTAAGTGTLVGTGGALAGASALAAGSATTTGTAGTLSGGEATAAGSSVDVAVAGALAGGAGEAAGTSAWTVYAGAAFGGDGVASGSALAVAVGGSLAGGSGSAAGTSLMVGHARDGGVIVAPVCPLALTLYSRSPLLLTLAARPALALTLTPRPPMAFTLRGCRND
jgi:hypothetical protein